MNLASNLLKTLLLLTFLSGCAQNSCLLEPNLCPTSSPQYYERLPSAFPPLTEEEAGTDWGKEMIIGQSFGKEGDLYRAITAFKRARLLIGSSDDSRLLQIQFGIMEAYYFGQKWWDMLETFEKSGLPHVTTSFPAISDLLIMLYDAYHNVGQIDKAETILEFIEKGNAEIGKDLLLYEALREGEICLSASLSQDHPAEEEVSNFLCCYQMNALSPRKAQTLNAILPGAGYYYVGQKRTALTSFAINGLFTWATVQLFQKGQTALGFIALSFEMGWYFGGINGAGLAAKYHNQRIYEDLGRQLLVKQKLCPFLLLETSF